MFDLEEPLFGGERGPVRRWLARETRGGLGPSRGQWMAAALAIGLFYASLGSALKDHAWLKKATAPGAGLTVKPANAAPSHTRRLAELANQ